MPHHSAHHKARLARSGQHRKTLLRRLVLAVAIVEPAMTLPQIYEIWVKHESAGVSALTWGLYISAGFVWLLYGLLAAYCWNQTGAATAVCAVRSPLKTRINM